MTLVLAKSFFYTTYAIQGFCKVGRGGGKGGRSASKSKNSGGSGMKTQNTITNYIMVVILVLVLLTYFDLLFPLIVFYIPRVISSKIICAGNNFYG